MNLLTPEQQRQVDAALKITEGGAPAPAKGKIAASGLGLATGEVPAGAESVGQYQSQLPAYDPRLNPAFTVNLQAIPEAPKVDLSEMIKRRMAQQGGYTAEESGAARAQMAANLNRQAQVAQRQMLAAQARGGIRGGQAVSQGQQLAQNLAMQRAGAEQKLFIENIAEQQRRQKELEALQKSVQFSGLAGELARMQMAQAELASQRGQAAAQTNAAAQIAAASGGGGCCGLAIVTSAMFFGANDARAQELIQGSKTGKIVIGELAPKERKFVDQIQSLRLVRDRECSKRELRGYYRLSEALAKPIKQNPIACKILNVAMVQPIVRAAEPKKHPISAMIAKAWIKFYGLFGSSKAFVRSNGEIV